MSERGLCSLYSGYLSSTASMDRLPVELHREIFCHLAGRPWEDPDADSAAFDWLSEARAPYLLASVCRRWRELALRTPALWAFIRLCDGIHARQFGRARVNLSRAGKHPLYFILDGRRVGFLNHFFDGLQLVKQYAPRLVRCYIHIPYNTQHENLAIFEQAMPLLRELRMIPTHGRSARLVVSPRSAFGSQLTLRLLHLPDCPQLERLDSHAICIIPASSLGRLKRLSYNLRNSEAAPLWATLTRTPALEELIIVFPSDGWWRLQQLSADNSSRFENATRVELLHLHHLAVFGSCNEFSWADKAHLPALHTLTASVEHCDHMGPLFKALRQQLRHLVITSIEDGTGTAYLGARDAEALDQLYDLESFELRGLRTDMLRQQDQAFFEHLSGPWPSTSHAVVDVAGPRGWAATLPRLVLRDCELELEACETLARFVHTRLQGRSPFIFELINCKLTRRPGTDPPWLAPVRIVFGGALVDGQHLP